MKKLLCLSTLFFLLSVPTASWAQTSKTIEGVAIDSKGVPLPDGNRDITFYIYDSIDGDVPLWSEQQTVAIKDGRFSATLGSVNSLELPENKTYWLGMKVGEGKELSPRLELNLAAENEANDITTEKSALVGNTLDMAYDEGGAGAGRTITADAGAVDIAGPDGLTVNGSVGIGTTSPNAPLQVANYLNFANGDPTSLSIGLNAGNVNAGAGNAFVGNSAGLNNTTGISNVAIGRAALQTNVTGSRNMAIGTFALFANTASGNVSIGKSAMSSNTSGSSNVGLGESALGNNLTGINNMAIGTNSLLNTDASNNIGIGVESLKTNTSGAANTGIGTSALKLATSSGNVAIGFQTGQLVSTGANNQLFGFQAGDNITTGANNLIIGYNIDAPSATASNQMSIGNIIFGTNIDGTQTTISSGNIGIGTAAPNEQLEITGNFRLPASTATAGIIFSSGNRYIHNFGSNNFFAGVNAGNLTMTGNSNTASGVNALFSNTTGNRNTAFGKSALFSNTTGINNTASGELALQKNTTGGGNTASGKGALRENTLGSDNTASGVSALRTNTTGGSNTASGAFALFSNTTGGFNTASGRSALSSNTTGTSNIAVGFNAGNALTTGDNNIAIGNPGLAAEASTIRIGTGGTHTRTFIAGINGVTTALAGTAVLVDANGQLGTISSSRRYKQDIRDMAQATDDLMKLRPVMFTYKSDLSNTMQYGLIAEEVAEVYPELVVHSKDGQIETVRYHLLNSMLLNELQKQHNINEQQKNELNDLKSSLEQLEGLVQKLAAATPAQEKVGATATSTNAGSAALKTTID